MFKLFQLQDYGIDFDDVGHPVKAFKCRCGSNFCRDMKRSSKFLKFCCYICLCEYLINSADMKNQVGKIFVLSIAI